MPSHFKYEASVPKIKPPKGEVVVATDGSSIKRIHSSAYLASSGEFGIVAAYFDVDRCQPHCPLSTELRAALYGLRKVSGEKRITLLTDNMSTVGWINRWKEGDEELPEWYGTLRSGSKASSLEELREAVRDRRDTLRVAHVKGHSGDLLNEAADALAGIGTNTLRNVYDASEARQRSMKLAESFLRSYQQSQ